MKKNINICILLTLLYSALMLFVAGFIPFGTSIFVVAIPLILLLFNRKYMPEKWPFENTTNMPLTSILFAVGIMGLYQGLMNIASYSPVDFNPETIFFMGIMTPIGEEIMFRGIIVNRLKKHGISFAIIASAILFGLYHGTIVQAVSTTIYGICFGYIVTQYSILYTIFLHFINNCVFCYVFPFIAEKSGCHQFTAGISFVLALIGLIAAIIGKSWKKIAEFYKENKGTNEKGCYKSFFLSPVFITIIALVLAFTIVFVITLMGK